MQPVLTVHVLRLAMGQPWTTHPNGRLTWHTTWQSRWHTTWGRTKIWKDHPEKVLAILRDFPFGAGPDCSILRQDGGWCGLSMHLSVEVASHPVDAVERCRGGMCRCPEAALLQQSEANCSSSTALAAHLNFFALIFKWFDLFLLVCFYWSILIYLFRWLGLC